MAKASMKETLKLVYLVCISIFISSIGLANAKEPSIVGIKEMVKEAIKENPELIFNVVNRYAQEKRLEAQILKQFEESLRNRVKDTISDSNPIKGPVNAPITIIAYTDFQCAICSEMAKIMDEVMKAYPETVRLVFRANPSRLDSDALTVLKAALAANRQGRFWEYHDLLFENFGGFHERRLSKYARDLGLDMEQFNKDRKSEEIMKQIEADTEEAVSYGFREPPAFIINGVVMNGIYPKKYFTTVIDHLLGEIQAKGADGKVSE